MATGVVAVARGAWNLGVTRRAEYTSLAEKQYQRRITLPARRGMITDRHGEELAVEVEIDSIYADARKVKKPNTSAAVLASVLGVDESKLLKKLTSKRHFVWLARRVSPDVAQQVHDLGLSGIHLLKESKRGYPSRNLASHVIGFAGIDAVGLEGVELKFDKFLKGQKNAVHGLRDAKGRVVFAGNVFGPEGIVGNTVELTIDKTLQYYAEQELAATVRTFEAKSGQVVVMDPSNGEILALANWPTYNPNALSNSKPEQRRNRAVLDVLEPGSTFKVFTLAAALNAGVLRPDDLIYCERGRMELGDTKKVYIHDDHRDGWLNPTQCLKRSSNICFAKIALKLGKKRLYHYIRRFGFGDKTDVDLPFEARGTLHHFSKWYDIDAATIAFGQGIGATGLQMAAALSAVANEGVLMRPKLVRRIVGPDGETIRTFPTERKRRVISRYTAKLVGDIMTSVTEEGGTGKEGSIDGFLVAGKTGTAQKSEGSRGYSKEKWVASFMGFVPADKPRLVITVIVDEPLINHYGGSVAAPALRRIADKSLRYLGISPRPKKRRAVKPDKPAPVKRAVTEVESDRDSSAIHEAMEVLEPNQVATPDLTGMTMKQAMEVLAVQEIRPVFMGSGVAVSQIPAPNAPVTRGDFIQVHFRPFAQPPEDELGQEFEEDMSEGLEENNDDPS